MFQTVKVRDLIESKRNARCFRVICDEFVTCVWTARQVEANKSLPSEFLLRKQHINLELNVFLIVSITYVMGLSPNGKHGECGRVMLSGLATRWNPISAPDHNSCYGTLPGLEGETNSLLRVGAGSCPPSTIARGDCDGRTISTDLQKLE